MRGAKRKKGKQLRGKAVKRNAQKEARPEKPAVKPGLQGSGTGMAKCRPITTAQRKRDALKGNLRFEPVIFVSAEETPPKSFDVDALAEGKTEHEILSGQEADENQTIENSDDNSSNAVFELTSDDNEPNYIGDATPMDKPIADAGVVIVTNVTQVLPRDDKLNSDDELLGTTNDAELDELIAKNLQNTTENLGSQAKYASEIDSDIDSISDYESEANDGFEFPATANIPKSETPLSESEEDERLRLTLDDYDLSDADSAVQDYMDNMSDLDEDQIFALANRTVERNVQDFEDMDIFDQYDEYDEYFDELLEQGEDFALPMKRGGASERKKLKRQAREAMHAIKFGKIPLLWQRYPEEIHVREVLAEIRNFATQQGASLAFPPLDNNANWYVKELAQEHGMRPTVEGSHLQKYVVAHRTRRSSALAGKGINKLLTRRQVFRRSDLKVDKKVRDKKGAPVSIRVRHGHIVGQNASEISEENFGHHLMRQMGWIEGSGLGKENCGIVAPISATVKLTKTGLGGI